MQTIFGLTDTQYAAMQVDLAQLERKALTIRRELGDAEIDQRVIAMHQRWQNEHAARRERKQLEARARARHERVPQLHDDPEAYAIWLQRERRRPWIELGRKLNGMD